MDTQSDMPAEVLDAIRAKRKIQAIKLLRQSRGIGLKEAKEAVDAYLRANPDLPADRRPEAESGVGRAIVIGFSILAGYVIYRALV